MILSDINNHDLIKVAGFIGGDWIGADNDSVFAIDNPATGDTVSHAPCMGAAETQRAIAVAEAAWPAWRTKTGKERAAILMAWYQLLLDNTEDLARLMTMEQGKPLAESRGEVLYGASFIQWFAEEAKRSGGEIVPSPHANTQVRVTREPVGVAAMITPWNFPIAMITRKVAPALAAGCTTVIKPASQTPLSAIAVTVLAQQAGVPAGVINLVTGSGAVIGTEMCANPAVRVLSFTGSTTVGRVLAAQCAPTIKNLALELGGNAPFIVFDDADLPRAVQQMMLSKFRNAGQTCVCANRIYVQDGIYDAFMALFKEHIMALKTGNGWDNGVTIGPLIDRAAVDKATQHVTDCVEKGATVMCGGHPLEGNFFMPTLLSEVSDDSLPCCEETFAPVAPVFRFAEEAEVVQRANATIYGLSAYFCTRDLARTMRVSAALEAGIVGVNEGIISSEVAPFGGVKQSGIGREGGTYGMDEYTEIKYTLLGF